MNLSNDELRKISDVLGRVAASYLSLSVERISILRSKALIDSFIPKTRKEYIEEFLAVVSMTYPEARDMYL